MMAQSSWFRRFILPGIAFKAVVIGGGYATGRELTEFFLPYGPAGGLSGIALSGAIWSAVCALTFILAWRFQALDYRSFFQCLLGRAWPLFDLVYISFVMLILSVFGAAAGAIGSALFGLPTIAGTIALAGCIALFVALGTTGVEELFKYVTLLMYGTYILFFILFVTRFGSDISSAFDGANFPGGWPIGGVTYASYNVVGAVAILPMLRNLTGGRDAIVAGLVAGPLAILPALLFFLCMLAFKDNLISEELPSDYLLRLLGYDWLRFLFELMIFTALLESGAGAVHAINERISGHLVQQTGRQLSRCMRLAIAAAVLVFAIYVAERFGLIALIASGYRALAYAILLIFITPLLTAGVWRLLRNNVWLGQLKDKDI